MTTRYRAQLLLESEQHAALARIAEAEGRSISDLVREIVQRSLDERAREAEAATALQAVAHLTQIRERVREAHGAYPGDPLAEVRVDSEEGIERLWREEA